MEQFFDPKSIAVIGANDRPGSFGSTLVDNLIQGGFSGAVIPVNPKHQLVHGLKAYGSITEIETPPDLAIIATPIATAPEIVRQCVRAGTKGVIIIAAGGRELGEEGSLIEEQIQMARRHLPRGYSRELPRLVNGASAGLPRGHGRVLDHDAPMQ